MKPQRDWTKGVPEPIGACNRIEELENGEPLVDLRIASPTLVIHRESVIPFARKTAAEMAEKAAKLIPKEFRLGVVDAWRPIERQRRIYEWVFECAKVAYPDRSYASLRRTVNRWAAPTDQKAPPGHCTGAALDIWLLDLKGNVMDVCEPFGRFDAAATYTLGLSAGAKKHRDILVSALLEAGFSNCRDEWWHYSWGDSAWAVRMWLKECCYGVVSVGDPSLYAEQERISEEWFAERPNPFLTGK